MKTTLSILAMFVFALSSFGQTRKPVRRVPKTSPKLEMPQVKPNIPTLRVTVRTNKNERFSGLFVGGDAESVVIEMSGGNRTFFLKDVAGISFGTNKLTIMGDSNATGTDQGEATVGDRQGLDSARTENTLTVMPGPGRKLKSISGGVLNGKAVSLVKPEYPAAARAVRATGAVNVQVTIAEDGSIVSAAAVSGHPLLRQAAENAARGSKFSPTTLEGQPVSVTGIIVYNFVP